MLSECEGVFKMESRSSSLRNKLEQIARNRNFWILAVMLIGLTLLHYFTPQVRPIPLTPYFMERHAVERIVFLLPIAGATFAFGQAGEFRRDEKKPSRGAEQLRFLF